MHVVLVHSPAVGPTTWEPVAGVLRARGSTVDVPPLAARGPIRSWRDCVAAVNDAIDGVDEPIVLAGHSGAGVLLPAIGAAVAAPIAGYVFVDAPVPVASGETPLAPPMFLQHLRSIATDGRLPPWFEWFGEDVMERLLDDTDLRDAIRREITSLPLSFYEEAVPATSGWDSVSCGYVLLSSAYRDDADEARRRGWPVEEFSGAEHLHQVIDPSAVAGAIVRVSSSRADDRP